MQAHGPDSLLHLTGDLLGGLRGCALVPVESLNKPRFFHDLPHDPVPVPFEDMPIRGADLRHRRDIYTVKGGLARVPGCHQEPSIIFRTWSFRRDPAWNNSAEVRNMDPL